MPTQLDQGNRFSVPYAALSSPSLGPQAPQRSVHLQDRLHNARLIVEAFIQRFCPSRGILSWICVCAGLKEVFPAGRWVIRGLRQRIFSMLITHSVSLRFHAPSKSCNPATGDVPSRPDLIHGLHKFGAKQFDGVDDLGDIARMHLIQHFLCPFPLRAPEVPGKPS